MAIALTCTCGKLYDLKEEMAGKLMQCPSCGTQMRTPVPPVIAGDPTFARNTFHLHQKHMSLNEKYYVWDEEGNTLLHVERPVKILQSLAAIGVVVLGIILALIAGGVLLAVIADSLNQPLLGLVAAGLAAVVLAGSGIVLGIRISPKRHVYFYRDEAKQEKVMEVLQNQKVALLVATFTVNDQSGQTIALLRKNFLYNFFRKQWECISPSGEIICIVKEDSIILSLLRRLLGSMLGLLRTNFIFTTPDGQNVIGEFNRKLTLRDRYVLDVSADRARILDRRVALAMGVMLDTGEKR